jgi:hypothetical protein
MKAQNPSTSLGEGRDVTPSLAHPSQKQNLVVYTEELTHLDRLLRVIPGHPLLEINQGEITSIIESSKGLFIKTASRKKALFVSSGLVDYPDFRGRLEGLVPRIHIFKQTESHPIFAYVRRVFFCFALAFAAFGLPLYATSFSRWQIILPASLFSLTVVFSYALLLNAVSRSSFFAEEMGLDTPADSTFPFIGACP